MAARAMEFLHIAYIDVRGDQNCTVDWTHARADPRRVSDDAEGLQLTRLIVDKNTFHGKPFLTRWYERDI